MYRRRVVGPVVATVAMALAFGACASGKTASPNPSQNTFGLSEFTVIAPSNTLRAGSVSITADNVGGEEHELVIVRAASVASLPTKSDGSVDEDKIAEAEKVGEIEHVAARSHKSKTFTLTAGSYVAFCNLVDDMGSGMMNGGMGHHVHYAAGMHVAFTVT